MPRFSHRCLKDDLFVILLVISMISLRSAVAEVGQPHQWALDEQKRLIKEKAEAAKEMRVVGSSGY